MTNILLEKGFTVDQIANYEPEAVDEFDEFVIGDTVEHDKFGLGTVVGVEMIINTVLFKTVGEKRIVNIEGNRFLKLKAMVRK